MQIAIILWPTLPARRRYGVACMAVNTNVMHDNTSRLALTGRKSLLDPGIRVVVINEDCDPVVCVATYMYT